MEKEPKRKITFGYILSLPFLGIFYVVDFFFKIINWAMIGIYTVIKPFVAFFKYVSLGCYYTSYVLLFPFI